MNADFSYQFWRSAAGQTERLAAYLKIGRDDRDESTVTRWLNDYRAAGLSQLLETKTAPGATRVIPPEVMAPLQARLAEPTGFSSYQAIWQWLQQECQVEVDYKTVYRIVRYELNAKLKVPRPRHHKQPLEQLSSLKKLAPRSRGPTRVRRSRHPPCATFARTKADGDY